MVQFSKTLSFYGFLEFYFKNGSCATVTAVSGCPFVS